MNRRSNRIARWLIATFVAITLGGAVRADRIELVHGGRVSGEILNRDRAEDAPYVIRTVFGQVTIDSQDVARVDVPRDEEKLYLRYLRKMPPTADGNWRMSEWCKEQNLLAERRHHLEEVIRLAPDHQPARKALDYVQRDGEWVTRRQLMSRRGFERHERRWRLPQEVEIAEANEKQAETIRNYRNQIKRWRSWFGKRREKEAVDGLNQLKDPLAVSAITEQLQRETNVQVQPLYIAALGRIGTSAATRALVDLSLQTDDNELRLLCLDKINGSDQVELAANVLIAALENKQNIVIHRAAIGLSRLKTPGAIRPLIDALITTHRVRTSIGQEGRIAPTFSSGPAGSSGGLSMGGAPKFRNVEVQNYPVLEALLALTDNVNFEFHQQRWREWYESQRIPENVNLRRDA